MNTRHWTRDRSGRTALGYLEEGAAAVELATIQGSIPESSQTSETFALRAARLLGWGRRTCQTRSAAWNVRPRLDTFPIQ